MAKVGTSNVNVQEIGSILNAAGGNVNINQPLTFFTTAAKINWRSKHKPIILNKTFCQDFDSSRSDYDATWWLGQSKMCGLTAVMLNSVEELPSVYDGNMNGWSYPLPTGGESQPLRLGDFCGYDSNAQNPMYNMIVHDMASSSNAERLAMTINVVGSGTSGISFLDMPTLKRYYLGLFLKHNTSTSFVVNTTTVSLESGAYSVNINPYGMRAGVYTAYPFIAEERQTQNQPTMTNIIYAIPGIQPLTLNVMSTTDMYTVSVRVLNATTSSVQVRITIVNNTTSSKTFTNNRVRIRMRGADFDDPLTSDDYDVDLGSITVDGNGTKNVSHTANIIGFGELQQSGVVYVSLDSASIVKSANYTISGGGDIM